MREIKFRAWNGFKMYKPLLLEQNENGLFTPTSSKGIFRGDTNEQILQQYTGLKDRNGKEIYEGDIVKCNGFPISEIVFMEGRFIPVYSDGSYDAWEINSLNSVTNNIEVIGNIFENKYLLI